jgi:hypothetical protein
MATAAWEMPKEYEIVDPTVKPDMAGTLGGVVLVKRDGKMFVRMTKAQAMWYLDHGTIRPAGTAAPSTQSLPRAAARKRKRAEG